MPVKKIFYKSILTDEIYYLEILIEHNDKLYILDRDVGEEYYNVHAEKIFLTFKFIE